MSDPSYLDPPSFVMSKYINKQDLYEAKADYYMKKSLRLERELKEYRNALFMFPGFTSEGLIGAVADVYPYQKNDFVRMRGELLNRKVK